MSLKITTRTKRNVTILDCKGKIAMGDGATVFRDAIRAVAQEGAKHQLLNMAEVGYIDTSGFGELSSAATHIKDQGGQIKLFNLPKRVKDLLVLTKLCTMFETFDDEATAVASFKGNQGGRS